MTDNPKKRSFINSEGTARAQALAQLLSKKKIDAIYSTDYKRTKATAQPTATNHGLSIETYDSKKFKSSHPNYFKTISENLY
jgi:broad specificity phosphatase PhoE